MASYFRQIPNFEYISRTTDTKNISEYRTVKNLFKRAKLRDDIFGNLSTFTKYKIIGAAAGSLFVFKGKYKAVLINYPNREEKSRLFS